MCPPSKAKTTAVSNSETLQLDRTFSSRRWESTSLPTSGRSPATAADATATFTHGRADASIWAHQPSSYAVWLRPRALNCRRGDPTTRPYRGCHTYDTSDPAFNFDYDYVPLTVAGGSFTRCLCFVLGRIVQCRPSGWPRPKTSTWLIRPQKLAKEIPESLAIVASAPHRP